MKEKVLVVLEAYGKISSVFLSAIILLISVATIVSVSLPKKLRVSFLDIGQGDAIFIQTPGNHNMLIDGGPTSKVVSELGKKMNHFDRHLDVMIATHGDADHITGLIPVLEKFSVSTIVRSPIDASTDTFNDLRLHIEDEDADIHVGYQGDVIDFGDGVVAHILYPKKNISLKTECRD